MASPLAPSYARLLFSEGAQFQRSTPNHQVHAICRLYRQILRNEEKTSGTTVLGWRQGAGCCLHDRASVVPTTLIVKSGDARGQGVLEASRRLHPDSGHDRFDASNHGGILLQDRLAGGKEMTKLCQIIS